MADQANSHVIHIAGTAENASPQQSPIVANKRRIVRYTLVVGGSGHHRFGSGTQGRFAANARLPFRLLIEEASGSVNGAQE